MTNVIFTRLGKILLVAFTNSSIIMKDVIQPVNSAGARSPLDRSTPEGYWTKHNVTSHASFDTASQSLDYLEWRNSQYVGYSELMPVAGFDDKVILDFGCGPGHDLVGLMTSSHPARLIGMDVSTTSLQEAKARVDLHGGGVELIYISGDEQKLPLPDASVDVIHSSGVLHHTQDPGRILREFGRILKPGGMAQIMVYNYNSIWMHLYVAYQRMIVQGLDGNLSLTDAFRSSTDGPDCPISNCYTSDQFLGLALASGLSGVFRGAAISIHEMKLLPMRWDALEDRKLNRESRKFLGELMIDSRGLPVYRDAVAGVDACFEFFRPK